MEEKKKTKKGLWIAISVVVGSVLVIASKAPTGVPECGSDDARITLMGAFDQSQAALLGGLKSVHAHTTSEVKATDDGNGGISARACRGVLTLNTGNDMKVTYTMELMDDGSYLLKYVPGW
jgi:hypothetical protein